MPDRTLTAAGDDTGQAVSHAIPVDVDVYEDGSRRVHDLLLSPRTAQSILRQHAQATAARRLQLRQSVQRKARLAGRPFVITEAELSPAMRSNWRAGTLRSLKAQRWDAHWSRTVTRTLEGLGFPPGIDRRHQEPLRPKRGS